MNYEAKLSDIIASLPEIEGGFLYSLENGLYGNNALTMADEIGLNSIAIKFHKINAMLTTHYNDTGNFRVTYKDLILFAMALPNDHWLFLFYQPTLSPTMLNMTIQLALNVESDEPETVPPHDIQQATEIVTEPEPDAVDNFEETLKDLLHPSSDISKHLLTMKEQLATFIGPVAELVFDESVKQWIGTVTPSRDTLLDLRDILLEEVDNEEDRETLSTTVATLLKEA